MLPILRFGVCRSSDLSIHVQETFFPHKRIASAFSPGHDSPSNDRFSPRARFALHGKQCFRNTATFGILPRACNLKCADCRSCDGFLPCPGFTPDSLVQRTRMRVRLLGSRMCHKSRGIQFIICVPNFTHTKRPLLPCYLAGKRSLVFSIYSVSVYAKITFLFK